MWNDDLTNLRNRVMTDRCIQFHQINVIILITRHNSHLLPQGGKDFLNNMCLIGIFWDPAPWSRWRFERAYCLHLQNAIMVQVDAKVAGKKGDVSVIWEIFGPGSSVGIAIDYGPEGPGSNASGDEIFRPSRPALGAHPASCKMGTVSFPGEMSAGACCLPLTSF
jgi:hypothetical protein